MTKKIVMPILTLITFVLELLPYGAVLNFANPEEGETIRRTYSYFDLTPYGYANFGPFPTAVLTSVLLILTVVYFFKSSPKLLKIIKIIAFLALVASISPLAYGISQFSVLGAIISVLLFCTALSTSIIKE